MSKPWSMKMLAKVSKTMLSLRNRPQVPMVAWDSSP